MASGPQLDSPGVVHNVMLRGIERPWILWAATQARRTLAYVWTENLVRHPSDLARTLDETRDNVSLAANRGAGAGRPWRGMVAAWCR